jgi:hypothetical protein
LQGGVWRESCPSHMSVLRINRAPSRRQQWTFAAAWVLLFGVLAARAGMNHRAGLAWTLGALAAAGPAPALIYRDWVRRLFVGASLVTYPIGWCVSELILGAVYFGVFVPFGWVRRALGHDPLARTRDRTAGSYWQRRGAARPTEDYFRQS